MYESRNSPYACMCVGMWVGGCRCDPVLALFSRSPSLTHTRGHFVPSQRERVLFVRWWVAQYTTSEQRLHGCAVLP